MTWISRVRVTGGFLDGLDLKFAPGLNVIVGPRGAGKTTLLELLRHALDLPGGPPLRDHETFFRHALGSGEVVLDLRTSNGSERLIVDASGGGTRPDLTADLALMLGQNELEEIADTPWRRLALVDMRAGIAVDDRLRVANELKKLTSQAHQLRQRQEELHDLLRQRSSLLEDQQRLRERETELLARSSGALAPQREQLAQLERGLLRVQADLRGASELRRAKSDINETVAPVRDVVKRLQVTRVEQEIQQETALLLQVISQSVQEIVEAADHLERISDNSSYRLKREDIRLRGEAEPVRTSLDRTERGLGAVTAELRDLDAQLVRLGSVEKDLEDLENRVEQITSDRQTVQELLEDAAEALFDARDRAARAITDQLDHRVQIAVRHLADTNAFRRTLTELLQGNGLQHNVLGDTLATTTLPLALLRYVEQNDVGGLSESAGLPLDRAARVISALNTGEALSRIATSGLHDSVDFRLQDGAVLKSAAQLSTGQKCAVTMPIVLTDPKRIVILDQPEDHLDNQFLVNRIITSLASRTEAGAQTIVATHNPNIPVLGGATQVANLASDGKRGLIDAEGSYDSPSVVHVITTLMEGGRQAFDHRARFYAEHPAHDG